MRRSRFALPVNVGGAVHAINVHVLRNAPYPTSALFWTWIQPKGL